mgnify:CR=1 FL=1
MKHVLHFERIFVVCKQAASMQSPLTMIQRPVKLQDQAIQLQSSWTQLMLFVVRPRIRNFESKDLNNFNKMLPYVAVKKTCEKRL